MAKLNIKQQKFVQAYLKDPNATNAAIKAGYSVKTARTQGSFLLTNPDIRNAVGIRVAQALSKEDISVERVLQERARLAFFDVRKLLDSTGKPKAIHELDDDTAAAIAGIEVVNIGNDEISIGEVMKVKFADKDKSLTALEKHLGMYSDGNKDHSPLNIFIHLEG